MDEAAIFQAFAKAKLTIDTVPDTCLIAHLRDHVQPAQWEAIRAKTTALAANQCQICGAAPKAPNLLGCNEVWVFADDERKLTLTGLAALCAACYRVKNIRRNSEAPALQLAVYQLAKVNAWKDQDEKMAWLYTDYSFDLWRRAAKLIGRWI